LSIAVWILYGWLFAGDPTTFGNLKPPKEVIEAIQESIASQLYNGYAPSTGKRDRRVVGYPYRIFYLFIVSFSPLCVTFFFFFLTSNIYCNCCYIWNIQQYICSNNHVKEDV